MGEIQKRLEELQARSEGDLDHMERGALHFLDRLGFESLIQPMHMTADNRDRWSAWAAESIVWTVREIRAGRWREALRGFGKLCEEQGRNGGFLPVGISDSVHGISRILQDQIGGPR